MVKDINIHNTKPILRIKKHRITMSVNPRRPESKKETLQEFEYRLKCEAKLLSLAHRDIKPIRYLCSNSTRIIKNGSM